MSRHGRVYRLDELTEDERFELREDGASYFGTVVDDGPEGIYVRLETDRESKMQCWPPNVLVRKA